MLLSIWSCPSKKKKKKKTIIKNDIPQQMLLKENLWNGVTVK